MTDTKVPNALRWINLVLLEVSMVEKVAEPGGEVETTDHRVGILPEPLQKLYTLTVATGRAAGHARVDADSGDAEANTRAAELEMKANALRYVFGVEVHEHFGGDLWARPLVTVRKGWVVVWRERPRLEIPPFLRGFYPQEG